MAARDPQLTPFFTCNILCNLTFDGGAGVGDSSEGGGGEGGRDGSMAVLLSEHATYALQLPEARFGIAQGLSYAPMMNENERECLDRLWSCERLGLLHLCAAFE